MNLQQQFTWAVSRYSDRPAVSVPDGETYTYNELKEAVTGIAAGFEQFGIDPGDRVTLLAPNCPELLLSLLSVMCSGATAVPINAKADADSVEYHLTNSDADALIYHSSLREPVDGARESVELDTYVQIEGTPPERTVPFEELTNSQGTIEYCTAESNPATIVYTSGTTGDPKGVPISHENWVYRSLVWILRDGIKEEDTVGLVLPLYHVMGISAVLTSIQAGATIVIPPDSRPEAILQSVESEDISVIQGVPTLFKSMADTAAEGEFDTSSLRRIESAGGMLTKTVFDACREHLCDRYCNFYGTTETMNIAYTRSNVHAVGRPADFQEVRLVEPESRDSTATVDDGEHGEVIVRMDGPEVFDGYLNKPGKTNEVVNDGWYFTEDIGYFDEEGRLWLQGRVDNLIISGGENISPSEVEDALLTHETVVEAGVVGKPDEKWGEQVVAFVRTDDDVSAEVLDEYCRSLTTLDDYKRPREYVFVDEIPKNPTGKIDRKQLKENITRN